MKKCRKMEMPWSEKPQFKIEENKQVKQIQPIKSRDEGFGKIVTISGSLVLFKA